MPRDVKLINSPRSTMAWRYQIIRCSRVARKAILEPCEWYCKITERVKDGSVKCEVYLVHRGGKTKYALIAPPVMARQGQTNSKTFL